MTDYYIEGYAMYPRIFEEDRDIEGFEGKNKPFDGVYEIRVGVPVGSKDYKMIMGWNKMFEPKIGHESKGYEEDRGAKEGLAYFSFKRRHKHLIRQGTSAEKEVHQWGGPPKVIFGDDNEPWPSSSEKIGNGSKVVVKVNVTQAKDNPRIHFIRLEAVKVLEHVKYESSSGGEGEEEDRFAPKTKADDKKKTYDDDIPF